MQSGRQTLAAINDGLRKIHEDIQEMDRRVKESSGALINLQRTQSGRFKRMAEIRLDHVISGELAAGLEVADQRAAELIRQRGQKLGAVNRQIKANLKQQETLDGKRVEANLVLEQATEALDRAEALVQEKLQGDPQYQEQLEKARRVESTAEHALEKTRQAETTRREKGQPYEKDPLFSYLWRRKYGTSGYSAGAVTRYLDDWVAGLCGYAAARPNYATLLEIPERLGEHARRLQEASDEEFISLTRMEVDAAAADGVPALKQALDQAQEALDAIDREIEEAEKAMHELERQRSRFVSGEDEDFQRAISTISGTFEKEKLVSLYEYARATATPEDDVLVEEIDEAREHLRMAGETLADRKRMRERQSERLQELEGLRRRFKQKRFDSAHSEFRNEALVEMALGQFLSGNVTAGELWRTIEHSQRYRRIQSNPTFGSGGFRPRPGTWHTPFPRGGGLGGGLGGGIRRRRGGFGGGFGGGSGGGGFRTGGGF